MLSNQFNYNLPADDVLPQEILNLFKEHAIIGKAKKGREIITQSDESSNVYYMISGKIKISSLAANTKEYLFREMGPGSIFGELAAIDETGRSVTVTAVNDVRYYKITQTEFLALIAKHSDFSLWVMKFFVKRIRNLSQQVTELSSLNVRTRILLNLIRTANTKTTNNDRVVMKWPKDQRKIAIKLGTHREAISREYSALVKDGLIEREQKELIIPSLKKLESLLNKMMGS